MHIFMHTLSLFDVFTVALQDAVGDSAEVRHPPAKTARLDSRLDQGLAMLQ